jgi:S1-C subfamily serine protease
MKHLYMATAIVISAIVCGAGLAQQSPDDILNAIVKVQAVIPDDAVTAPILGTERSGSGVLIDSDGLILTIGYLVLEASSIEVIGPDDQIINAAFVGYDYDTGFGLLKAAKPLDAAPMKLGTSSGLKEGDPALVASHHGSESVTGVRVISRGEFVGDWEYLLDNAIYTIPPYQNYGGAALIDSDGSLLGIGSIFTRVTIADFGTATANMFVPIDLLKPILSDLKAYGRPRQPPKPWLGVNSEESHGRVFITRILPGSPGEKSDLQINDLILKINQLPVAGQADFYRKLWSLGNAGVSVPLTILRGTEVMEITVTSIDRYQLLKPTAVDKETKETL